MANDDGATMLARVDILRDDVVVGLAGRVNTGKSATLAALCRARGVDRADVVVSAEPGHHVEIVKKKLVDNLGGKLEGCPWIMLDLPGIQHPDKIVNGLPTARNIDAFINKDKDGIPRINVGCLVINARPGKDEQELFRSLYKQTSGRVLVIRTQLDILQLQATQLGISQDDFFNQETAATVNALNAILAADTSISGRINASHMVYTSAVQEDPRRLSCAKSVNQGIDTLYDKLLSIVTTNADAIKEENRKRPEKMTFWFKVTVTGIVVVGAGIGVVVIGPATVVSGMSAAAAAIASGASTVGGVIVSGASTVGGALWTGAVGAIAAAGNMLARS